MFLDFTTHIVEIYPETYPEGIQVTGLSGPDLPAVLAPADREGLTPWVTYPCNDFPEAYYSVWALPVGRFSLETLYVERPQPLRDHETLRTRSVDISVFADVVDLLLDSDNIDQWKSLRFHLPSLKVPDPRPSLWDRLNGAGM